MSPELYVRVPTSDKDEDSGLNSLENNKGTGVV